MIEQSRRTAGEYRLDREEQTAPVSHFEIDASQKDLQFRYDRLADGLAKISARLGGVERKLQPPSIKSPQELVDVGDAAAVVREMIAARRRRSSFFPADMFADPAWDILLYLYLAELEQRRTMMSSLCIAAEVPATTALRWISALVERDMLSRLPDKLDRRRVYIELTPVASEAMRSYLIGGPTSSQPQSS